MQVETHKSLKTLNTLGFDHQAEHYTEVRTAEELQAAAEYARQNTLPVFILGGGSNLVITQDIPGLTIRLVNDETQYSSAQDDHCEVIVDAGVEWHSLVIDSATRQLSGIENLSLIPGTAGAAPVQNIGAYGVELKDTFTSLEALHLPTGQWRKFNRSDCEFAYRNSFFKMHPGEYAIYSITLKLSTNNQFNLSYAALANELDKQSQPLNAKRISDTVCAIRRSKLPDPAVIGNAGSFFKNPVISNAQYQALSERHPAMVSFTQANGSVKIAAGWLIDSLGFKGTTHGGVGVYDKQALVMVNHGDGTAAELMSLANKIKSAVADSYQIELEIEPQVL